MNPPFKYSGVHWIGKVPSNWNILALKRYAPYISRGRSPDYTDDKYKGIPIINQACIYWDGLKLEKVKFQDPNVVTGYRGKVYQGDLLINSTGTGTLGRVGVFNLDGEYLADSHVTIIRPAKEIFAKYLYYLLQTDIYQGYIYSVLATGATNQIELSREGLSDTPIIVPPSSQQKSIASFLDRKTAAIDTLIAKKQRLIQLLEEKRTALINHAVTKGLNPNAPMKESGISSIGEIPQHWDVKNLKRVCRKITDGEHISPNLSKSGVPLLSAKDIRDREIQYDVDKFVSFEDAERFRRRCKPSQDDLLIVSRGATIGRVAVVDGDHFFCLMGSVILLKLNILAHPIFLYFLLNKTSIKEELLLTSSSSAQQAIYLVDVADLIIQLPPIDEQCEIANYLDNFENQFQVIIGKIEKQLEKIQEYRRSLITAAVTGKLDISEVEPNE
jgi:type I restriction enzyme, S subunit